VGGVLIGTIAYRRIVNLLGVKLRSAAAVTADVDIAGKPFRSLLSRKWSARKQPLSVCRWGFPRCWRQPPALYGSRFKAREGEFKVEFLTPLTRRNPAVGRRTEIRQLSVPAIPLRFLDYLIEEPLPAVAPGRRPVWVRVPQPARYAVHKLIVARERSRTFALKAQKDLEQSFHLQKVLEKLDPESLSEAFKDARERGPGWMKRIDAGQEAMRRLFGFKDEMKKSGEWIKDR
jgi:hypothetical protein